MVCCSMEENILCRHTNKLIDEPHCALTSFEGNNKYKPKNKKKQNRSRIKCKKKFKLNPITEIKREKTSKVKSSIK